MAEKHTEHTPTPWHQGPYYKGDIQSAHAQVASCAPFNAPVAWANTEFIVTAVNNHAELVKALETLVVDVQDYEPWQRPCYALNQARAILAKVKKETALAGAQAWHCAKCGKKMQFFDGICFDCNGGRDPGD